MFRFSSKVVKRRNIRATKRKFIQKLIVPKSASSGDNISLTDSLNSSPVSYLHDSFDQCSAYSSANDCYSVTNTVSFICDGTSRYEEDDDANEWVNIDENDYNNSRPLYNGSSINVDEAIHRITSFYLGANLDKQKVTSLLRLIKSLLPQPNHLPVTWKRIDKSMGRVSSMTTTILCSDCYQTCHGHANGRMCCFNPNCDTSFRQRRSTELIEIVRFDIRNQIQSVLNRNIAVFEQIASLSTQ